MLKVEIIEYLDDYLLEEELDEKSKRTIKQYKQAINNFINFINSIEVTKKQLIEYKEFLIKNYKPSTVNKYITILNKYLKFIEMRRSSEQFEFYRIKKFQSSNVIKNIKVQQKSSIEDIIEPQELKRMLRNAKKYNYELYIVIKILAYTGIRISELKYFTVESIKKSNYLEVRNKAKTRTIIVRNDLKKEILNFCKTNDIHEGYIFRNQKNEPISSTTIYKRLKVLASKCRGIKLKKIHPHAFRHLFAVKFLEDGGIITDLKDILGHSSTDTTAIYTRTTDKMKRKKLERMKY